MNRLLDVPSCCAYTFRVTRNQVQLSEVQLRKVRAMARRDRVSVAEAIRRCVDTAIGEDPDCGLEERYARASRLVGAFTVWRSKDLATRHDKSLDEAYE